MTDLSNRPLGELEREVETSRTRLELALNDLGRQFTVDSLFAAAKRQLSDEPLAARADQLVAKAKANPLPVSLIGAGVAWLLLGDGGPDTRTLSRRARHGAESAMHGAEHFAASAKHGAEHLAGSVKHGAENLAGSAKHGAEQLADSARDGASNLAGSARESAASVKHGAASAASSAKAGVSNLYGSGGSGSTTGAGPQAVRHDIYGRPIPTNREFDDDHDSLTDRARGALSGAGDRMSEQAHAFGQSASHLADDARYRLHETRAQSVEMVHRAGEEVREAYRTNPVVLGLGVAAVASLVGVLLPNSRRENETMGPYARDVRHRAEEAAGEALEQAEKKAEPYIEKAEETATEVVGKAEAKADEAIDKTGKAIDKAGEAAKDTGRKVEDKVATAGKKDTGTGSSTSPSGQKGGGTNPKEKMGAS